MKIKLPKRIQRLLIVTAFTLLVLVVYSTRSKSPSASSFTSIDGTVKPILHKEYPHHVIQDIQIKNCVRFFGCDMHSSSKDPGEWVKIPKELQLNSRLLGRSYLFKKMIPVSTVSKSDIEVIRDVAVNNAMLDKQIKNNKDDLPFEIIRQFNPLISSQKVKGNEVKVPTLAEVKKEGWTQLGNGLWVKKGRYVEDKSLTDLTVLFGRDCVDPRPQWNLLNVPLINAAVSANDIGLAKYNSKLGSHKNDKEAYISFTNNEDPPSLPEIELKPHEDGKFKILQVADLHFSTGYGHCRDTFPPLKPNEDCLADPRTLEFVNKVLDIEAPDLVIMTGDQVFGDEAPDAETALYKVVEPFVSRNIPFAMTFGNHDDEGDLSREQLVQLLQKIPYSLTISGPSDVTGVGNYVLTVGGEMESSPPSAIFYLLDSHKYSLSPRTSPGYDYLKEDQIEFVQQSSKSIEQTSKTISMAFFHIPLPEYRDKINSVGEPYHIVGQHKEAETAPVYNTFMRDMLTKIGVSVLSVGHDHCNDYCLLNKDDNGNKIWLCYGGASGEGGYAGYGGTTRRLRTFVLDTNMKSIISWKRLETSPEAIFDQQQLL